MKFSKNLLVSFLAIFILEFVVFKCSAVKKDQIIIGTYEVYKSEAYNYVKEALENGFTNIDTSKDYFNQCEVGMAIRDFESKGGNNHAYVIAKFSIPNSCREDVFIGGFEDELKEYIKSQIDETRKILGHVDEFIVHKELPGNTSCSDVARAFGAIKKNELYKDIKFGISTITTDEMEKLILRRLIQHIQVVQNPYWYGSDFLVNLFYMGDKVYDYCKKYGIKYETYRSLGRGRLVKERHFSPAALLQHSINKGYVPIVKATGQKHLSELVEKVDEEIVLPEVIWDNENSTFNIEILNYNQLDVINSKQYWYR